MGNINSTSKELPPNALDLQELKLYFHLYEKYFDEIHNKLKVDLSSHPLWGAMLDTITPQNYKAQNKQSLELQREAIYHGNWVPYKSYLQELGKTYAKMNVAYSDWYEVTKLYRTCFQPYILSDFSNSAESVLTCINGLVKITDYSLKNIAKGYLDQKEEIQRSNYDLEELMSFILTNSEDAVFSKNLQGVITHWNPSAEKMFGYSVSEIIGKHGTLLIPPDRENEDILFIKKLIKGESIENIETDRIKKDGTIITVSMSVLPIKNSEGAITGLSKVIRDITEQKKVLLERNIFFEHSIDIICTAGFDGYFKSLNPAFSKTIGFSDEELLSISFLELVHPSDVDKTLKEMELIGQGHAAISFINRYRCKNEEYKWFQWNAVKVDELMYCIARDITQQIVYEEELQKSIKEISDFKYALDNSSIVSITDQKGIINYANDNFCTISKYSKQELIGQDHRIINSEFHSKDFFKELWTTIANGKVWKGEIKNKAKDGTYYWVDSTIVPFLDEKGKPFQYVAIRIDITAQKLADKKIRSLNKNLEKKVKARTKQLSLILSAMGEGLYGLDLEGKITFINPKAAELLGSTVKDLMGQHAHDNHHYKHVDGSAYIRKTCPIYSAFKDGLTHTVNTEVFWRADGSSFPVEYTSTPIHDSKGALAGAVLIFADISKRKYAEEEVKKLNANLEHKIEERTAQLKENIQELKKAEAQIHALNQNLENKVKLRTTQLEVANHELESFSYSVAHDLRSPLRGVIGYSSILKEDYEDKLDSEGQRILNEIEYNTRRMGNLIDDLLTFSRLGRKEISKTKVIMNEIVNSCINDLNKAKLIKATIHIAKLHNAEVDVSLIKNVITNLLSNAIKYSSKKDNSIIHVKSDQTADSFIYSISDNGVGFDMAYASKLFGVFQRLHSDEEFEGTGVGLAIVQKIIHRHGGKVWAQSKENEGATFYFSIPKLTKKIQS